MANIKNFIDQKNNINLATANIPDDYAIGGIFNNQFQSIHVPFTYSVFAVNSFKQIKIYCLSEEKYIEHRSQMLKAAAKMDPNLIKSSIRDYTEPDDYLYQFATYMFEDKLNLVGSAESPTLYNTNPQISINRIGSIAQGFANQEAQGGYPCNINNLTCKSYLYKYTGTKDNVEYVVLAAMDFEGYEVKYQPNMMTGMFGLFGSNKTQANKQTSNVLGHGDCDLVEWGSRNRYLMIAPVTQEDEASQVFINFLATYQMDPNLEQQYNNMIMQKSNQIMMQTAMYQAQTQANIQSNMYQQQKLTNMLRNNSESISAGIMDSWNKKMDSEFRMSNNFSEAIRGVNTYTTTDGRNVEVGVSADHVYENKYGDVYGVSGNAIDDSTLSKINWTEIHKK